MKRRRWTVLSGIVVVAGVAAALAIWRPWAAPRVGLPAGEVGPATVDVAALLDPTRMVKLSASNKSGSSCKVSITGGGAGMHTDLTAELPADGSAPVMTVPGPFTIEAITIERGGAARRHVMNVTLAAGQSRELRVGADESVEVVAGAP